MQLLEKAKYRIVTDIYRSLDYHILAKNYLEPLANLLIKKGYSAEILVDIDVNDEKRLAQKANLGVIGKNSLLINDKYGRTLTMAQAVCAVYKINGDAPGYWQIAGRTFEQTR